MIKTGKFIDETFGKGSVAVMGEEAVMVMTPTNMNNVPHCIIAKLGDDFFQFELGDCYDTIEEALEAFAEEVSSGPLTFPMLHRFPDEEALSKSWGMAAALLEEAAKAARQQEQITRGSEEKK